MSVAGAWKLTSHSRGWSARAAALEKSTAEAAAPAKNLALARNFLIALSSPASRDLVAPITDAAGIGNPGLSLGWFKPYSISLRKKGAEETVRHFCAQAEGRLQASPHYMRNGRNSGEFALEKHGIADIGAGRRRSRPLLGPGAA
jgi:hypothetical protein